jgi:serine/threonine protein kinase
VTIATRTDGRVAYGNPAPTLPDVRVGDSPPSYGGTAGRFDRGEGVGEYQFIVELARSGTGTVYLAVARGVAGYKMLAVKELRHELLGNEDAVAAFLDEGRIAARLNHPNLVRTIEVGKDGARPFLAMEHVDGQLLQRVVRRAHRLAPAMPLRMHLGVVTEVLSALEYAHSLADLDGKPLGLVHRYVSPQNVCITYEGRVKLLDFGAAPVSGDSRDGRAGTGKSSYVAPECLYGKRVDGRADIFAVGAMLYEAMLWSGPAGYKQSAALHGASDPALFAIVQRAMSGDPDVRYPTARAMRDDLGRYASRSNAVLPDARELSGLVSSLFAQEHKRQQAFIEARLSALDDPHGPEPSLGALAQFALTPTPPPLSLVLPTDPSSPLTQRAPIASASQAPRIAPITAPPLAAPPAPVPTRSSSIGLGIATAAFAIIAAGSVALFAASRPRPATIASEVPLSAPAAGPSAAPAEAVPAAMAHVVLRALPPSARLYVDDVPVPNPYVADRPLDATPHRARAEAAGYAAREVTVAFDRDDEVALALAPYRPAAKVYLSHSPPPPPPPSSHPSLHVSSEAPPPAVEEPAVRPPSPPISAPISAIETPAARPVREIRKENPYLQ